jgi:hypothetical protein
VRRLAVILCGLLLIVAACGGDGEEAATTTEPPATGAPADTGGGELPAIVVETPAPDETVTSPVTVAGSANVFEANVTIIVLDADGNELARDFTTATCGTGCRGDYSLDLEFAVGEEQAGTIVVQDDDAAGTGTPPHQVEVPVTLAP